MTWKLGHRGACGYAPENTAASIKKALELGVDGFEFDIQLSKDNEPVIIHDDTLDRTTNGKGEVSNYTLKELQQFDAGKGERIPSLRDLLDLVDKRCRLFVELKADGCEAPVADVLAHYVAKKGWRWDQIFVCSFNHLQIVTIRKINPNILTCALLEGIPVTLAAVATEAGAWGINPYVGSMNQALIDDAHKRKLKVITWTANTPRQIAYAKSLGVDGIISDYPDRL